MIKKVCSGCEELRRLGLSDELGIVDATRARNGSEKHQLQLLCLELSELKKREANFNTSKAKLAKY